MKRRDLVILGSTGSIGRSALDVIRDNPERFGVRALACGQNIELLEQQYRQVRPPYLCVADDKSAMQLKHQLKGEPVTILNGEADLISLVALDGVDMVLNAMVGAAGLMASVETIRLGRKLALANKESLVAGGPLFADVCAQPEQQILPIDSEHSAIWQALRSGEPKEVRKIILTASGGPFRNLPADQFARITVEQALAHPTWTMGRKITIDSATMVNKGLEVLEAVILFGRPARDIEVVIHPQSIVHSMVEFCDSSVIAQMSKPDMRLPINYALFWPERVPSERGRIDWQEMSELTFDPPDYQKFPALKLAYEVAEAGGIAPAVFNAANEVAVDAFLNGAINFTQIVDTIRMVVEQVPQVNRPQLDDILRADRQARDLVPKTMEKMKC